MSDELPGLDAWITRENDPGSSRDGHAATRNLHCEECAFVGPLLAAIEHHRRWGHPLTFRGVRQDFSRVLKEQFDHALPDVRRG